MSGKNRIGIVGGGQLGRMLTLAAAPMGFEVSVVEKALNCPAAQVGARQIEGGLNDSNAIKTLAEESTVVTFEIEHINTQALKEIAQDGATVHPSPKTLETIKDKFSQKEFLSQAGIPTAEFIAIDSEKDNESAGERFGYPFMLKARHGGYDGRGNFKVEAKEDIQDALKRLSDVKLYAEKFIPFSMELAVMVAQSTQGDIKTYPVVQTIHERNICQMILAPAPISQEAYDQAEALARQTMEHLHGAGVFGIEMFLAEDGRVLVNEIAPRVHNSGHYTIEACDTSQFQQHIRAITGMTLGSTQMRYPAAVMVNILGERDGDTQLEGIRDVAKIDGANLHWYGKSPTKVDRKMGHITVVGKDLNVTRERAEQARRAVSV